MIYTAVVAVGLMSAAAWSSYSRERAHHAMEPALTDRVRSEVIAKIDELWTETGHPEWQYLAKRKPRGMDGELVTEFTALAEKIDKLALPTVPDTIMVPIWIWSVLGIEMSNINSIWTMYRQSQARPDPVVYSDSWKRIADISLNDSPDKNSVYNSLLGLQDMIWDRVKGHKNVFQIVNEEAEEQVCESNMSPQQLLYNLFSILQVSQLKAYSMIQFSWLLLRIYNKGNFTSEADLLRETYMERMSQQAIAVKESLKEAEPVLWKCDPRTHEEGKTYTRLTKVLQGFLVNEVDLNNQETCREDCPFYTYTKQYNCYKGNYCQKQPRCTGNVVGCQFVDSDMWVCQAPHGSKRRYDWIEYENGRVLGAKQSCQRPVTKVDSWWRYLFWHCSFCFCYCDDPKDPQSDRYFNLRAVMSDKDKNRVVTGIRFTKANRIVHLQIQQGELLPLGGINETTLEWKPVDPYKIKDDGVTVGEDYHMLTWESRSLDLDELKVPPNSIITGVKFRRVGGHLNLEVQSSMFNFTEGKLLNQGEKSFWISNDKTDVSADGPRKKLHIGNPDVPTKSVGPHHPDSKVEQFVEFGPSDIDFDAGQTTVPFLDTQDVSPTPPLPLSGIGLFHKGRKYSGGFVAPKVYTYDFTKHITEHFPEVSEAQS